jgi:hypothetical protein
VSEYVPDEWQRRDRLLRVDESAIIELEERTVRREFWCEYSRLNDCTMQFDAPVALHASNAARTSGGREKQNSTFATDPTRALSLALCKHLGISPRESGAIDQFVLRLLA